MKKIGILCASDTELAPFLTELHISETTEKAMLTFHSGTVGPFCFTAVYSGVCKVNAAIAAQLLIDHFHTDVIINAGVAGGMDEAIQLFDTVISDKMMYHDVAEDILTEFHPWLEENFFQGDKVLLDAAKSYSHTVSFPIVFGTMVTGEQFIKQEKRKEINESFAPLSVDMETTSVAHVCYVNQIPFLSVRTISDTASEEGIETFEKNCETASKRAAKVVLGILETLALKE